MKYLTAFLTAVVLLAFVGLAYGENCWDVTEKAMPVNCWEGKDCGCCSGESCDCGPDCPCWGAKNLAGLKWKATADGTQAALYNGKVQVGAYRFADNAFRSYNAKADTWGPYSKEPIPVPQSLLSLASGCGSSGSSQLSQDPFSQAVPVQLEGDDSSSCQSGSNGSAEASSGSSRRMGPIRRLFSRLRGGSGCGG